MNNDPSSSRQFHFGYAAIGIGLALVIASQVFASGHAHPSGWSLAAFLTVDLAGVVFLAVGTWLVYRSRRKAD